MAHISKVVMVVVADCRQELKDPVSAFANDVFERVQPALFPLLRVSAQPHTLCTISSTGVELTR